MGGGGRGGHEWSRCRREIKSNNRKNDAAKWVIAVISRWEPAACVRACAWVTRTYALCVTGSARKVQGLRLRNSNHFSRRERTTPLITGRSEFAYRDIPITWQFCDLMIVVVQWFHKDIGLPELLAFRTNKVMRRTPATHVVIKYIDILLCILHYLFFNIIWGSLTKEFVHI